MTTVLLSTCNFISVFRTLARHARQRFMANNASKLFLLTFAAAATFGTWPADPNRSNAAEHKPAESSPILDAILQNTPGQSQGYAVGVPKTFAWCRGVYKPSDGSVPPPIFTAVTGWGQVYPKAGAPRYSSPDGTVTIANAKTYVHLSTTREWILVQNQATDEIAGGHFAADFARNAGIEMKARTQPDGSVVVSVPPTGYNDHFWITKRGTYTAGSVDGVYVQMDMKTNDPNLLPTLAPIGGATPPPAMYTGSKITQAPV
jgi:hypothetical protein